MRLVNPRGRVILQIDDALNAANLLIKNFYLLKSYDKFAHTF